MDGVFNFFKPRGMTSHDAVYFFRRLLNTKKVGHTGTLDPNATGVLPICIGKGTRVSEYLLNVDKEYVGELTLGLSTDTLDADGVVTNTSSKLVNREEIISVFNKYKGEIEQIPPMYSALKVKGKKLYEMAREGKTIDRASRVVNIKNIEILDIYNDKEIIFKTKCSRGTYIRTLCDDIGNDLGTYGYMSFLIRTQVGSFNIENAYSIETLSKMTRDELQGIITPVDSSISHIERIIVPDSLYNKLVNGALLPVGDDYSHSVNNIYRIYCKDKFIGIGKILFKDRFLYLKMDKVLI